MASNNHKPEIREARAQEFLRLAAELKLENPPSMIAKRMNASRGNVSSYLNYGSEKRDGTERKHQLVPSEAWVLRFKEEFRNELLAAGFTEEDLHLPVSEGLSQYRTKKAMLPLDIVVELQQTTSDLKNEVTELKKEIVGLKEAFGDFNAEVSGLKAEITGLKEVILELSMALKNQSTGSSSQ